MSAINHRLPRLYGDGIQDDTAGLQALLDAGGADVYFPPPTDHYLIGKPLVIHSGQTLRLDNLTRIRLAPRADTVMLTNADHEGGNEGISLIGGIWDMDNRSQSPNPFLDHGNQFQYSPEHYLGVLMRLVNVRNLTIRGLTLRDPVTFGIQLARLENFTIEDITFDYTNCNPIFLNMDGVHIHGPSRFGRIANLKGSTHDDMVALNADDGHRCAISTGPIEDVSIDGLYAENGHTGVRLLSMKSPVRRVRIDNVFGSFRVNAISFSNFRMFKDFWPAGESRFEDISLRGLYVRKTFGKPDGPHVDPGRANPDFDKNALVWIESGVHVGNLSVTDYQRTEDEWAAPSIAIERGASVDCLSVSHMTAVNRTLEPMHLLTNEGQIGQLSVFGAFLKTEAGQPRGKVLCDTGMIGGCCLQGVGSEGADRKHIYRRGPLPDNLKRLSADRILDFPAGYKGYVCQPPATLEEDAQADAGCALIVCGRQCACPVWYQAVETREPLAPAVGAAYAWHFLGEREFRMGGAEYLGFGECGQAPGSGYPLIFRPIRNFISPSLPPGRYGIWMLARCEPYAGDHVAFRLSRVVLAKEEPCRKTT
ncbi:MAG: hypothetical protein K9N51_09385 [Candidatus Pacebacteria bacterium]|nr:hypothetical protein [Candidatus Paceibacterota bacterium]